MWTSKIPSSSAFCTPSWSMFPRKYLIHLHPISVKNTSKSSWKFWKYLTKTHKSLISSSSWDLFCGKRDFWVTWKGSQVCWSTNRKQFAASCRFIIWSTRSSKILHNSNSFWTNLWNSCSNSWIHRPIFWVLWKTITRSRIKEKNQQSLSKVYPQI